MKFSAWVGLAWLHLGFTALPVACQIRTLLPTPVFQAIRDESTGEQPRVDFENIVTRFSGFTPSKGGDGVAEYIAARLRGYGVADVNVEGFPSDGKKFYWGFLGEPAWEGETGLLTMVSPAKELLADFSSSRAALGRFSTNADVTADLVDVGEGTAESDYSGKDVRGKIVLVTGNRSGVAELAHRRAVWAHGAVGVVIFRTDLEAGTLGGTAALGNRFNGPAYRPWEGPGGEKPGFVFSLSPTVGTALRERLRRGEHVTLHAIVKASTGPGEYKQVTALVRGTDPGAPEVWIKAHDNFRNTGGGNNLTGVGAVIEVARVLNKLIAEGAIPRPRRTIRFLWSAEHFGDILTFRRHPELPGRVLAFLSVDMVGFNESIARGAPRLARSPHSRPHFLSDVCEDFFRAIGDANSSSSREALPERSDAIFSPTGTRDEMHYSVEDFWGPSDHEDMAEATIGIPAVEYGHPFNITDIQEDTVQAVDATQMRREVVAIAATAEYLASAGSSEVPRLAQSMQARAEARMARDTLQALDLTPRREALNVLRQSLARELAALDSLRQIADTPEAEEAIGRSRKVLEAVAAAHRAELAGGDEKQSTVSAAERRLSGLVAKRGEELRGPVSIFRSEFGALWLADRVGGPEFMFKLKIAALARYAAYEALNFADGKRNLLEVRDLVSAEFGPIPAEAVEEYFRFLERAGLVSLKAIHNREGR
jgi:hypothetical protein